ncbi:MAG: glycosyltransferase family 2 protein [Bacteroidales bacterium]|nr:glycosyltransferase family 2 protein [Bacteroidales bacterium]
MQRLKKKFQFFYSFIKELGGIHVFLIKILKVLIQQGFKEAKVKAKYLLKHADIFQNTAIDTKEYQKWIHQYEMLNAEVLAKMTALQKDFKTQPLISVIMPAWNSNPQWLKEAIESVRKQIYPNWELCIADDASTKQSHFKILHEYQKSDSRIKVLFRNENGHISEASNSALKLATGEYVALLDHDDLLTQDAFFYVVAAINKNPDAALIYTDEDKIDKKGKRLDPYFKCDWNYSLFLGQNFPNHLTVYKRAIITKVGGFRQGFEGSQDYDLALRCIEQIDPSQIVHIPSILYQWRQHKESTAEKTGNKSYAVIAGQRALQEHLQRTGTKAEVEILPMSYYRIKYKLPQNLPFVSIIIPTRNNKIILEQCIQSILSKTDYPNYELLVIDNKSDHDDTLNYFAEISKHSRISVLKDERPFNFSAINNRAVQLSKGDFILFLNDDTEVISSGWLSEMVSILLQPGVGAVGAKLLYPNETIQHAGVILGIGGVGGHVHKRMNINNYGYFGRAILMQEFSALTAACLLVRTTIFDKVGGFDEVNLAIAFNDVDLCLKIREKGYRLVFTPFAQLYHHESVSRGDDLHPDKVDRFNMENNFMLGKWQETLRNDQAYNPNLTLEREDFSLAWPPRAGKGFLYKGIV